MIEHTVTCIPCTKGDDVVEFPNMLELKKHEMMGHTTRWEKPLPIDPRGDHPSATEIKAKEAITVPSPTPLPMPVEWVSPVLTYKWQGKCKKCNTEVRTIVVPTEEYDIAVCFCVNCNNQIGQQKIIPIDKQFKKEITLEEGLKGKKK